MTEYSMKKNYLDDSLRPVEKMPVWARIQLWDHFLKQFPHLDEDAFLDVLLSDRGITWLWLSFESMMVIYQLDKVEVSVIVRKHEM